MTGADNRSRTYDLRITNAMLLYFYPFKNILLKQVIHYKTCVMKTPVDKN